MKEQAPNSESKECHACPRFCIILVSASAAVNGGAHAGTN